MATTVKIQGLKELDRALSELPKATAKNVLRRTLVKASEPMVTEAANLAPDRPGTPRNNLSTSIVISSKLNKEQKKATRGEEKTFVEMYVGPDVSVPNAHGGWHEFGTINHGPQPFMRPAWDSKREVVLDGIAKESWAEIQKAAQRLARRAARAASKG
jgi:HK97 gp10 family phage protein